MIYAIGAYGRQYKSIKDALIDWKNGKDFKLLGGPYFSIRDKNLMLDIHDEILIIIENREYTLAERKRDLLDRLL